ncbi:hypothetical protein AAC387_Pa07g2083 [Persea americana]
MLVGELFLFGIYSCYVSAFDLREKGVERGEDGEVDGGNVLVPGGVRGRLVLAGFYNTAKGASFVLWRVEEGGGA